jgi:hypothetical protein
VFGRIQLASKRLKTPLFNALRHLRPRSSCATQTTEIDPFRSLG